MRRPLTLTIVVLFVLWLASLAILLLYLAELSDVRALVAAVVAQVAVFVIASALLISTNTRRPAGVDPDAPTPVLYGRRKDDDGSVLDRLSAVMEEEAAKRPLSSATPAWLTRKSDEEEETRRSDE